MSQMYENTAGPTPTRLAFPRRAYGAVWNQFFCTPDQTELTLPYDTATIKTAPHRPTTTREKMYDSAHISTTSIPATNLDDLRAAFAQERFERLRAYYGEKYTDFLAAMGVSTAMSIADEPELIGQKHASASAHAFEASADVTGGYVGEPHDHIRAKSTCQVKRKFFSEHGLIMALGS